MNINILRFILIYIGIICLVASRLFASTPDTFGLSSRSAATGGLLTFGTTDPSATYQNPAFLTEAKKIRFSMGLMSTADFFRPIKNVIIQSEISGKSIERGDVETNYSNLSGMNFGLIFPLKKDFPSIASGIVGFMPFGSLASVNTAENYIPLYGAYFNRPKRLSLIGGIAIEPIENISLGVGANMYLTSGANTLMTINQSDNQTNSTVSLAMDIRPAVSLISGIRIGFGEWNFDLSFHDELDYVMVLKNRTELGLFSFSDIPVIEFLAQSSMFYDPRMVGIGIAKIFKNGLLLGTRLDWKNWGKYKLSFNQVEWLNPGNVQSRLPEIHFKDIISPSFGLEFPLRSTPRVGTFMRAGYRYEPEHVKDQETNSNFIDTDTHIISAGFGKTFDSLFGQSFEMMPLELDLHVQYHMLTPKRCTKTDPTAVGYSEGGYEIGGSLLNYGLTLGTTF